MYTALNLHLHYFFSVYKKKRICIYSHSFKTGYILNYQCRYAKNNNEHNYLSFLFVWPGEFLPTVWANTLLVNIYFYPYFLFYRCQSRVPVCIYFHIRKKCNMQHAKLSRPLLLLSTLQQVLINVLYINV